MPNPDDTPARRPARPAALLLLASLVLPLATPSQAEEGMWTFDALPLQRMQHDIGFAPDADWVRHAQRAMVRLAGGCSGSFVSSTGLVLTNHHCGVRCVEELSSAGHDLVHDGFLARRREDEIKCPDIELNRLEDIHDVTAEVIGAIGDQEGAAAVTARRAVEARLTSACAGADPRRTRCDVVELYHGARYHLYRYRRFQDVRLVFAPELATAFFGGDPDNFNFPRYDLDCAILRAYEGGVPARIDDFLAFRPEGAAEHEPVFVAGHPGHTDRQLTVSELATLESTEIIPNLLRLSELRGFLTRYGAESTESARTAYTDLFSTENARKAYIGRLETLQEASFQEQHRAAEQALRDWVAHQSGLSPDTAAAWDRIAEAEARYRAIAPEYRQLERALGFNSLYFGHARMLVRAAQERPLPNAVRLPEFADAALPRVEQLLFSNAPIYPDYEIAKLGWSLTKLREVLGPDHALVRAVLGKETPLQVATRVVRGTRLGDRELRRRLWEGGAAALAASDDPAIQLARQVDPAARAVRKIYEEQVESVVRRATDLINRARFARDGTSDYPDATFTLRLSYGRVEGWQEDPATRVAAFTTFGGAFERNTGSAPFALPASWLAARDQVPAGQALDFATTNDIIGGNSGSPVFNRQLQLVGLVFDGNIHSLGGDFVYEPQRNRAVAVHAGAILSALERIYGAPGLAAELRGTAAH